MTSRERVVVVGASGFGRECLDVLDAMVAAGSAVEVAGVVDDGPSELNLERLTARGVGHLGTMDGWLASAVYVMNDLIDREQDRLHPKKKSTVSCASPSASIRFLPTSRVSAAAIS